jgi:hypothetical protein
VFRSRKANASEISPQRGIVKSANQALGFAFSPISTSLAFLIQNA